MKVEAVLGRAQSMIEQGIRYKLGKGGMNPGSRTPASADGRCDCTGYVAWCLGMSRKLEDKFYLNFNNGWFETTAVWNDIGSLTGIFEQLNDRRPGAIVVFPDANGKQGHIGIVLDAGTIAHCSKGHDSNHGDAILADDGVVFNGPKSRVGWLVGLT